MDVGLHAMSHMVTVSLILQFHTFGPFLITFLSLIIIDIKKNIFHSSESVHHSQLIANFMHKGTTIITHGKHGLFFLIPLITISLRTLRVTAGRGSVAHPI